MKKSTKILIAVLILLGVIYAIQRFTHTTSTTENSNPFLKFDTSKVNKITVNNHADGKEIVIVRENRGWFITNPLRFLANQNQVKLLLSAIASNPSASVAADSLTDGLVYGLGAVAPTIGISSYDQRQISLRVGNVTPDFDGCYVEIDGRRKILDLAKNIKTFATQPLDDWRDKRIFDFTLDNVQAVDFAIGDTLYHFLRMDTVWHINGHAVPLTKIREVIGVFIGAMAMDFVDTSVSNEVPFMDFGFSLGDGMREVGKVMRLGQQTFVSNSANNQTYIIESLIGDDLERGLREIYQDYLNETTLVKK